MLSRRLWFNLLVTLTLLIPSVGPFASITSPKTARAQRVEGPVEIDPEGSRTQNAYVELPVYFIENLGQKDNGAAYYAQQGGVDLYFTAEEMVMAFPGTVLRTRFVGANPDVRIAGADEQAARFSYFAGDSPEHWQRNLRSYGRVVYRDLYPGVDLAYTGRNGTLKYEFILEPGADAEAILLTYEGIDELSLADNGDLLITPEGAETSFRDDAPYVYQQINGREVTIGASFTLYGDQSYGFSVEEYDRSYPLVIDPQIHYSTFLGGNRSEVGQAIALDNEGNVYVAGETNSGDFPVTSGAYDESHEDGNTDVFVSVLDPTLSNLLYSTFLTASRSESIADLIVDDAGNVFVTGSTNSDDFPTTAGAYSRSLAGGFEDVFVSVFDATLTNLLHSTYLGDTGPDFPHGLALNEVGLYIVGETGSDYFPTTSGAYSPTANGYREAFVAVLAPSLSSLRYATFLGGGTYDRGYGVDLDSQGGVYVVGTTRSDNFPVTEGAYDLSYNEGLGDAFVSKLDATLSTLEYSTFLGGSNTERSSAIVLDDEDNVYVAGKTSSSDYPTTMGAYDPTYNSEDDAFVSVLDPTLGTLSHSTFLGGSGDDNARAMALDAANNVYLFGTSWYEGITWHRDFPITEGADGYSGGANDTFLSMFSPTLDTLHYSGHLGGWLQEWSWGLTLNDLGGVYLTGDTMSSNFPTTGGAYDANFSGETYSSSDAFVSLAILPDLVPPAAIIDLAAAEGSDTGEVNLSWTAPGDDINGGTAMTYTVRYAATAIETELGWLDATDVAGAPAPQPAGSSQSMAITGLIPGHTYYFAIRTEDEAENLSPLSNSPSAVGGDDVMAPAMIDTLTASTGGGAGEVKLGWSAPGDDDDTGTAKSYTVRHANAPIETELGWLNATDVTGEPTPLSAGTSQTMTVTGLAPSETYYFAIRAEDEVGNVSSLSNSPVATAAGGESYTISGQVLDNTGTPLADITVSIADGFFDTTGADGNYTIAGLEIGTYTITPTHTGFIFSPTIRTITLPPDATGQDFIGNRVDTTGPSAITDLAAKSGSSSGEILLTWTAPGDDGSTGTATAYTVRYADTPIETELGWFNATDVPGEPAPEPAGTQQSMIVRGLAPGQSYYFAIRAEDEAGNVSPLSNSPHITLLPDSDGDGLPDSWETDGYDADQDGVIDVDLPAMGADPNKKDIFVEVDWMVDDKRSQQPDPNAIEKVVDAFASAPVDGTGINLHVDVGPGSIDFVTGKPWGDLAQGNGLPYQDVLGEERELKDDLNAILEDHFEDSRSKVFHYAIFASRWAKEGIATRSSGVSFGNQNQVFVVSLGCFKNGIGSVDQQAGTFMHELGHNLGLEHGGFEDVNYKPNYLSVMNYSFQMGGLILGGTGGHLDYSRWVLPDLDETQLSEPNGLAGGPDIENYGTKFHISSPFLCIPDSLELVQFAAAKTANGPVNWNCNVKIDESPVAVDVNNDEGYSILRSHDDWNSLSYTAGSIGALGASRAVEISGEEIEQIHEEITPEENDLIRNPARNLIHLPLVIRTSPSANAREVEADVAFGVLLAALGEY